MKLSLVLGCIAADCPHETEAFLILASGKRVPVCDAHAKLLRFKGYEVETVDSAIASVLAEEGYLR